jgi:REP element-mobilizing transposase RayT
MTRPLRIEFAGAVYHITSRGNARENIFIDREDRRLFLSLLEDVKERYNWLWYGYCLMSNHYHLLIETPDGNLSIGMRHLNGVYTQNFNKRHQRTGHIFQGRFKAILVQKESYLLEVYRYVVLNPVRAGLVSYPEEWKWSSYLATMGMVEKPKFLCSDWILAQLGHDMVTARKAYRDFVITGIKKESPWKDLKGGTFLGKENFIEEVKEFLKGKERIKEIPRIERFVGRPPLKEIFGEIKTKPLEIKGMYAAHVRYGYTLKEIGDFLGIHYSTVSKLLKEAKGEK